MLNTLLVAQEQAQNLHCYGAAPKHFLSNDINTDTIKQFLGNVIFRHLQISQFMVKANLGVIKLT